MIIEQKMRIEFLRFIRRSREVGKDKKEKATTDFARLSPFVGMRRLIVHISTLLKR